jgi:serine/threonine-protein kinase
VLGALAIVIAVLIVINARNNDDSLNEQPPPVTETVIGPPATPVAPSAWTQDWTQPPATQHPGDRAHPRFTTMSTRLILTPPHDEIAT